MTRERGSIPMAVMIGVGIILFVIVALAVCGDAIFEDEDEDNDLGWAGPVATAGDGDGDDNRGGRNDNGRECEDTEDCSSFSPSFEDSPIIVCVQPDACRFG